MSISYSGRDRKVEAEAVRIEILKDNPLLALANALPWPTMMDLVVGDLKATTAGGMWWIGRKLLLRVHLAIFILQKIFDLSDRSARKRLQTDAAFQAFCGNQTVEKWSIPAFQKLEACKPPSKFDIDSTVQEINMSYSADGSLLQKLGKKIQQVFSWLSNKVGYEIPQIVEESFENLGALARGYFFASRKDDQKIEALKKLIAHVKAVLYEALDSFENLTQDQLRKMPSNIRLHLTHIQEYGKRYVLDVAHYLRTGSLKAGKILAFHLKEIAYINKNKPGKKAQFGREFQLGRIGGNFVITFLMSQLRANDKNAMESFIKSHTEAFGEGTLVSVTGDRGYYSKANLKAAEAVAEVSLGYQWEGETDQDFRRL